MNFLSSHLTELLLDVIVRLFSLPIDSLIVPPHSSQHKPGNTNKREQRCERCGVLRNIAHCSTARFRNPNVLLNTRWMRQHLCYVPLAEDRSPQKNDHTLLGTLWTSTRTATPTTLSTGERLIRTSSSCSLPSWLLLCTSSRPYVAPRSRTKNSTELLPVLALFLSLAV